MKVHGDPAGTRTTRLRHVEGLRAIAVAAVVAFHTQVPAVTGGFDGVDIFFVISGFVITRWALAMRANGTWSVLDFFLARARRLLPALLLTIVATLVAGGVVLLPDEWQSLGKFSALSAIFVSNLYFYKTYAEYFAPYAVQLPLLHLWSLSLEAQFYLCFGAVVTWLFSRRYAPWPWVLGAGIVSFAASVWLPEHHPFVAYYLLPARTWEFMLGSGAVLCLPLVKPLRSGGWCIAALSLAAVATSFVVIDDQTPWPGTWALLPCVATALLCLFGDLGPVESVLSHPVMQWLGARSYSIYLWHWPVISLLYHALQHWPSPAQLVLAVAATLLLSETSYRWVEQPVRKRWAGRSGRRQAVSFVALGVSVCAVGYGLYLAHGLPQRFTSAALNVSKVVADANPFHDHCLGSQTTVRVGASPLPDASCLAPGSSPASPWWVVWGDSHADAIFPGIRFWANPRGYAVYEAAYPGCAPVADIGSVLPQLDSQCEEFNRHVLQWLERDQRVRVVMLVARWPGYVESNLIGVDEGLLEQFNAKKFSARRRRDPDQAQAALFKTLSSTIERLKAAGKEVVLMADVPELLYRAPQCLARPELPAVYRQNCDVSQIDVEYRQKRSDAALQQADAAAHAACMLRPRQALCDGVMCRVQQGNIVLYRDSDHFSAKGAQWLVPRLGLEHCPIAKQTTVGLRSSDGR